MNWKRIKWGWYIYQIDFNDSNYWETHDYCTNWTSGPQAHIVCDTVTTLQKLCLDNCLSNAWLLALDTCDTGKLWHNLCHFFHNATIHWIPILLCAVTPLLLVAHGKAHRCEKITSKTRQCVSTFDCAETKSRIGCFEDQQICKQDSMRIFNWFALFESLQKKGKVVKKNNNWQFSSAHVLSPRKVFVLHVNPGALLMSSIFFLSSICGYCEKKSRAGRPVAQAHP